MRNLIFSLFYTVDSRRISLDKPGVYFDLGLDFLAAFE